MHSIWVPAAVVSGILLLPVVQWGRTPVNLSKLGPQAGQRVPDFNLKDQNGKPVVSFLQQREGVRFHVKAAPV